ncbi:DUF1194 domain-containing protein [Ruegeria sediminis]|uniref:DUF1194 domain-containing protein n=1 Tax=Ruegeria sediminis TaxID=2583820 RepID=A0ABY2X2L8_9RHOB|nr:DUF1194 domain-containing protein [Ruegeria sediminis]TMV09596.1 DUF1194 domain-containing protein [Ruegeria sediminis]
MIRALSLLLCLAGTAAPAQCRQALALGLDVSGSVDSAEYRLQIGGLANALRHPDVAQAMLAQPAAPVRLAIFEWSEPGYQRLLLDWTEIRDPATLARIADRLDNTARSTAPNGTAVGSAMMFGASLLAAQAECWKRTLDLSGDGKHNMGPHPRDVRLALKDAGLTINGLVIGADDPRADDKRQLQIGELSAYYAAWVALGPDAFVEIALGFHDYEAAMVRKLKRELESMVVSALPGARPAGGQ